MQSIYELTMIVSVDACATIQSWKKNQLLTWREENNSDGMECTTKNVSGEIK